MHVRSLSALAAIIAFAVPSILIADDGPLNPPPGPIASTPGPEPRRELNLTNTPGDADSFFKITASGSYYLPQSFSFTLAQIGSKNAIEVDADNVTIDFNGFSLQGINNAFSAVRINPGRRAVTVRNGHIQNFARAGIAGEGSSQALIEAMTIKQVGYGVSGAGGPAITINSGSILRDVSIAEVGSGAFPNAGVVTSNNCVIERVAVTTTTAGGIVAGGACEVRDCTAWALTGNGISAGAGSGVVGSSASLCSGAGIVVETSGRVAGCSAVDNTGNGISASFGSNVTDSTSQGNDGHGFLIGDFGVIARCTARLNSLDGINCAGGGGQVLQCTVVQSGRDGIVAAADTNVIGCSCDNNGSGAGIRALGSDARIDGNTCTDNLRGIDVDAPGCIIIRNFCAGNTTNFDIVANNVVGVIVSAPLSPAIVGSAGGAGVGTTNPWGNVSY